MRFMFFSLVLPFVSFLAVGCITRNHQTTGYIGIHSELIYSTSGYKSPSNQWDGLRTSKKELDSFSKIWGLPSEDIASELADPFISTLTEFICFHTVEPASKIAQYYETEFLFGGWREKRGILLFEWTNGGGDWLKVYSKEDWNVLIHIIGRWDDDFDELKRGELTGRTVTFRFYRCTSDEVFGKNSLGKVKLLALGMDAWGKLGVNRGHQWGTLRVMDGAPKTLDP